MWLSTSLIGLVRLLIGAYPRWVGCAPSSKQRIYFANHSSHLDALVLWSALSGELRAKTHPVAAKDYWGKSPLRRHLAQQGFNAIFIERHPQIHGGNPLRPLIELLERGESLILFPEGTRHAQALPGAFKSGLYHLAQRFPEVELVPVYLENLHRSMPKGTFFPIPLICSVRFGAVLECCPGESKQEFLARAREAVVRAA